MPVLDVKRAVDAVPSMSGTSRMHAAHAAHAVRNTCAQHVSSLKHVHHGRGRAPRAIEGVAGPMGGAGKSFRPRNTPPPGWQGEPPSRGAGQHARDKRGSSAVMPVSPLAGVLIVT